ncbi:hypothetical protein KIPE111705_42625 [Kibdelosporangium persicum]|uniref:High-affnity carbon uptake protein Hat/HatR n=1 Tax=Kibdelosporangium persicum TaxID=2698649 RepID=A0ABX2EWX2_9PSEU|nr:hypothetical protein [Kibdelosporangium persicum]NRN63193.1 High-affnity carbon uptake protein Hat/HatR [Kibdelosporangium persicum]
MTNPWVGLRPFRTSESDLFFGRDREVQVVSNLVATLPTLIVYAPSGTGKSSLINAGLLPVLLADKAHVPVTITDPRDDILARTRAALADADWESPDDLDLLPLLEQHWVDTDRRTVVIVDQFEERINAGVSSEDLFATMAKLVHSGTDAACVLISVREDYLASLEPLMRRVPGLLNGGYRIPSLSREALEQAVYGPLDTVDATVAVERSLVTRTIDDLEKRSSGNQEPGEQRFEPGFFQIIWSTMWSKAQGLDQPRLDLRAYEELGGASQILSNFTSGILNGLEPAQTALFWAVSRYLVLPTGAKTALTVDDLADLLQKPDFLNVYNDHEGPWLSRLPRDELVRLIRSVMRRLTASGTPILQRVIRLNREEFELLHDLLGKIILEWREEHRRHQTDEAKQFISLIHDAAEKKVFPGTPPHQSLRKTRADYVQFVAESDRAIATLAGLMSDTLTDENCEKVEHALNEILTLRAARSFIRATSVFPGDVDVNRTGSAKSLEESKQKILHAALNSDNEQVRRGLQLVYSRVNCPVYLSPRRFQVNRASLWAAWTGAALLAFGSLAVPSLLLQPVINHLGISYHLLTITNAALVLTIPYGMMITQLGRQASFGQNALRALVPFTERRKAKQLLITWPLPAVTLQGAGIGFAWMFQSLGWASTAGYVQGVALGLVGVFTLLVWAADL